jgi:alpha-1,6-mannosyltransferase
MIKTLHITNAWHAASGGVKTWYKGALDAANREGRPLRLVVPGDANGVEEVGSHGRIYRVRAGIAPFDPRYRLLMPHRYLLPAAEVRRILVAEQPDLLEICDKYTLNWLAGLLRKDRIRGVRRPVLVGLSCERADDNVSAYIAAGRISNRLIAAYCRWCYAGFFDYHLAVSEYVAEELRATMPAHHRRPVLVASPGVNISGFSPGLRSESLRRAHLAGCGAGPDGVLVLYAGRLSPEKNVPLLVDVLHRLTGAGHRRAGDYCLVLAGDGPLAPSLHAEAARARGRLRVLGHLGDASTLARLYASADVFVHPNPREPFGIAPLEAMASGCPVVLPSSGGVLSYANPSNAWLARPTPEDFAVAVQAASDGAGRAARVARALETAQANTSSSAASRVFRMYDRMHAQFWENDGAKGHRSRAHFSPSPA